MVKDSFPGPKTRAALERGFPLFTNGLRFEAEMLADIMPGKELPKTNYEVSGTEAAEAAVHLLTTKCRAGLFGSAAS